MGITVKKRQLIVATLVVALGTAVFVNWYYSKPQISSASGDTSQTTVIESNATEGSLGEAQLVNAQTANEYFTKAKINRDEAHDEALEALNDIIKDSSSSPDSVTSAQKKLEELSTSIKTEADIENLITAKIGSECLVTINGEKIQVVLNKNTLNDTISTQITDIIVSQSDKFSENITLIETK